MRRIQLRTAHKVTEALASEYHSIFRGQGIEFEEVRPYTPGDDVRQIDWNVSARMGEPYIKLFREERELSVIVAADLSASQEFGSTTRLKREQIAELVATVALSAIANGDRAGVTILGEGIERHVPPRRGPKQALRVIREILAFDAAGCGTDLAAGIDQLRRMLRKRSVVVLVSDFLDDGFMVDGTSDEPPRDTPAIRALRLLRRRHDVVPVIVVDRRERDLPPLGLVEFRDRESGRVALMEATRSRSRAFAEAADRRRSGLVTLMRRIGIEPIVLASDDDVAAALTRYFARRRRAR
ncbi:MAG TPA: DUF58 domain-containing protein [Phycisphaerales bacterium]|nr:DUF58 domain-containing protein [Phycisphaerales bacterium]HMP38079.1 DUF58 domain-containing protein [Phycisphaerales bacterium]